MSQAFGAIVWRPGEGRPVDLGNFAMTVKASGSETDGLLSLLEADEPPGFGPPMHVHHDCAEVFYVLAGEYRIFIGDDDWDCPAGSFIYIPLGVPHGFRVGSQRSRKLNLYTPGAMVGYFDDLSEAIRAGEPDPAVVTEIGHRHGLEVIGPVPEGYL
ncbi:MAG: cupin domain-containing protein [Actinomycetota bacterium]|nr:cupin domain-containing protein [Actinomycetota bacterium]